MRRNQQHQKTRAADKAPRAWPGPPARPSPPLCRRARTPCVIAFPSPSSSPLPKFLFPCLLPCFSFSRRKANPPNPSSNPPGEFVRRAGPGPQASPRPPTRPGDRAARPSRPGAAVPRRRWCPGVYAIKYDTPVIDRSLRPVDVNFIPF